MNSYPIDDRSSVSYSWRQLFRWYFNFRCLMFTRLWLWKQGLKPEAFLYLWYDSWSESLSGAWVHAHISSRAFLVAWHLVSTIALTLRLPCIFLLPWRICQVGFEAVCWQCSSSGDIKTTSMKFSRRSRMFSAPWCNAGPRVPAKQLCIYCL